MATFYVMGRYPLADEREVEREAQKARRQWLRIVKCRRSVETTLKDLRYLSRRDVLSPDERRVIARCLREMAEELDAQKKVRRD